MQTDSYMSTRLTRTPLLSPQKEKILSHRIRAGGVQGQKAKNEMVEANMRLVITVAKGYLSSGIPLEDLVQEGALGLMIAAERFEPERDLKFSTYAVQWIRHSLGRAVDNKSRLIRLPAHISDSKRKLDRARQDSGLEASDTSDQAVEIMSRGTGMSLKKVQSVLTTTVDPVSLQSEVSHQSETELGEVIADPSSVPLVSLLIRDEIDASARSVLSVLDERERDIIQRRLENDERGLLASVGEDHGISLERAREIEKNAIRKLNASARMHHLKNLSRERKAIKV